MLGRRPFGVERQVQDIVGGRPATYDPDVEHGSPQASKWPWIVSIRCRVMDRFSTATAERWSPSVWLSKCMTRVSLVQVSDFCIPYNRDVVDAFSYLPLNAYVDQWEPCARAVVELAHWCSD